MIKKQEPELKFYACRVFYVVLTGFILVSCLENRAGDFSSETARKARNEMLETFYEKGVDALPLIVEALEDDREAMRRTAAHLIDDLGASAREAFDPGLKVQDEHVNFAILEAILEAGMLEEYIEPVVTHEADSVRQYFYYRLLPQQLLVDGKMAENMVEKFDAIYYGDISDEVRREMIRHFYLRGLREYMIEDDKPSDDYIEILEGIYGIACKTARRRIVDAVSDLTVTDASARLLANARDGGENEMAETARRALIVDKLQELEESGDKKLVTEFESRFDGVDFDTWPEDLAYEAFYMRGQTHRRLGNPEAAIADLKRAISYRDDKRAYQVLGNIYRDQLDEPELAVKAFKNAARRDWASHVNHRSVLSAAAILRDLGRPEEALELLVDEQRPKEIEELGSTWGPRYVRSFANTLEALGDYEAAIEYYRRMLEADFGERQNEQAKKAIEKLEKKMEK